MFELLNQKSKSSGFGLYINDQYVQAAQLTAQKGKIIIAGAGQENLSEGAVVNGEIKDGKKVSEAILKLLSTAKPAPIKETICFVAIPENQIYEYAFTFPLEIEGNELRQKIKAMIKETIPIPPENIIYRFNEEIINKTRCIFVYAARKNVLKDYLKLLRTQCNLDPQALEPESRALIRNLQYDLSDNKPAILIHQHADKLVWLSLIGVDVFESGISKNDGKNSDYKELVKDLKTSIEVMTDKMGVAVKDIIIADEIRKKYSQLEQELTSLGDDLSLHNEQYVIGNFYYKVSCSMGLTSFGERSNREINFQK